MSLLVRIWGRGGRGGYFYVNFLCFTLITSTLVNNQFHRLQKYFVCLSEPFYLREEVYKHRCVSFIHSFILKFLHKETSTEAKLPPVSCTDSCACVHQGYGVVQLGPNLNDLVLKLPQVLTCYCTKMSQPIRLIWVVREKSVFSGGFV